MRSDDIQLAQSKQFPCQASTAELLFQLVQSVICNVSDDSLGEWL